MWPQLHSFFPILQGPTNYADPLTTVCGKGYNIIFILEKVYVKPLSGFQKWYGMSKTKDGGKAA